MTFPIPDADAAEQRAPAAADEPPADVPVVDDGDPEADVVEQAQDVGPAPHTVPPAVPLEADAADAAEQSAVVPLDEDEGRE